MEVKDFAAWVKKNNLLDYKKSVFAIAVYVCFSCLYVLAGKEESIGYYFFGAVVLIVIALEVGRFQWNMYLYVTEDETTGRRKPIGRVVRLHAFPAEEYLSHVFRQMKRPATWISTFSFVGIMLGVWQEDGVWYCRRIVLLAGLCIVCTLCPYAMIFVKRKLFYYQLKMGKEGVLNLVLAIMEKIVVIVETVFLMCVIVLTVVFSWLFLHAMLEPPVDETIILFRNYHWEFSIIAILIFVLSRIWIFWGGKEKESTKLLRVLSIVCFFSAIVLASCETHIYTEFAGDEFRICNLWREEVYSIEEITGYRLYEEHGDIQMDIDFGDRKLKKVFGTEQTFSELYEEIFDHEYLFLLDYVGKLQKLGIKGEVEGAEDVEDLVRELNSEMLGSETD